MKKPNTIAGFTLVESLVAITILMIGVVGPLVIASRGISDGLYAQNQLAANYLAQEAMTTLINWRDRNLAENENNWLEGIDLCIDEKCGVNGQSGRIGLCSSDTPCQLVYDSVENFYLHPDRGENHFGPEFTRFVELKKIQDYVDYNNDTRPLEIKALVTVFWFNRSASKSFTLVEHFYLNRPETWFP